MIRRAVIAAAAVYAAIMFVQAYAAPSVSLQAIAAVLTVIIGSAVYILSRKDAIEHAEILILWICILCFAAYAIVTFVFASYGGVG